MLMIWPVGGMFGGGVGVGLGVGVGVGVGVGRGVGLGVGFGVGLGVGGAVGAAVGALASGWARLRGGARGRAGGDLGALAGLGDQARGRGRASLDGERLRVAVDLDGRGDHPRAVERRSRELDLEPADVVVPAGHQHLRAGVHLRQDLSVHRAGQHRQLRPARGRPGGAELHGAGDEQTAGGEDPREQPDAERRQRGAAEDPGQTGKRAAARAGRAASRARTETGSARGKSSRRLATDYRRSLTIEPASG